MHLNFTDKNYGTTDLLDDANGQLRYTIRSSVDGKMNTVRRPAQESSPDARGLFIARIHRHAITSDKVELQEGERSKAKEWMQEEGHGRTFTTRSGRKYTWLSRQHGDAALQEADGKQVAYLHDRSSSLFGGEKRKRASLEVDDDVIDSLDDFVVSCLYFKLLDQRIGVLGTSLGNGLAIAVASSGGSMFA